MHAVCRLDVEHKGDDRALVLCFCSRVIEVNVHPEVFVVSIRIRRQ